MGTILGFCVAGLLLCGTTVLADSITGHYGDEMPAGEATPLVGILAQLEPGEKVTAKMSGTITKVCKKKGCWMVLADGESFARVTFKDYGFFVPKHSDAYPSIVYGELSSVVLPAEQADHYAADAGETRTQTGDQQEFSIVASAVEIQPHQ